MSAEASLSRCPVEHIVLYPFKNASDLNEAAVFIKSLQNSAQRTGKSYIRSIKCGSTRVSPPDRTQGYNLVSYFTFASDDDRAFFVKEDEAHQRLIKFLDGKLDKGIMVFDFIDGEAEGSHRVFDKQTSSACDHLLARLSNQRPPLVGLSEIS